MARRETEPTQRVHVVIFKDDYEFLMERFGDGMGVTKAVRKTVRNLVKRLREREASISRPAVSVELTDEELEDAARDSAE